MDQNQWMNTYKQLETERYSKEAFMNGVLLPELSIPIKMPGDGQRETHSFIQRKTFFFQPTIEGKFIIFYFPSILAEEGETDVLCIRTGDLDTKGEDKFDGNKNNIFPGLLHINKDVALEYRVPASSIRVNCLKQLTDKDYAYITGTVAYIPTSDGKNTSSILNSFRNASGTFSQRLGTSANTWVTQRNSANVGSRIVYIPKDNNDYEFKTFGEIPKVLQCHIIWGTNCPMDLECMQIQITRHIEIGIKPKWNDILMPFSLQNSHILASIRNEISRRHICGS